VARLLLPVMLPKATGTDRTAGTSSQVGGGRLTRGDGSDRLRA
jgi:hypothetical protein